MFPRRKDFHSFGEVRCGKGQVYIECSTCGFCLDLVQNFDNAWDFQSPLKLTFLAKLWCSQHCYFYLFVEKGEWNSKRNFSLPTKSQLKRSQKSQNIRNVYLLKCRNEPLVWAFVVLLYCSKLSVRPLAVFNFFKKVNQEKSSLISQESNQISWE